jgi:hypothetical protein
MEGVGTAAAMAEDPAETEGEVMEAVDQEPEPEVAEATVQERELGAVAAMPETRPAQDPMMPMVSPQRPARRRIRVRRIMVKRA